MAQSTTVDTEGSLSVFVLCGTDDDCEVVVLIDRDCHCLKVAPTLLGSSLRSSIC
jgi:hypothetical protein